MIWSHSYYNPAGDHPNLVEQIRVTSLRARWTRVFFYYAPLVFVLALALYLATAHGDYNTSLSDLYKTFAFLGPEYQRPDIDSMYGINGIARRLAYLVQYGLITVLLVRALQSGVEHFRQRSLVAIILFGIFFIGLDNAMRNRTPGRHGGWDDILLSLLAVVLTTGIIYGYFTVKQWERDQLITSHKEAIQE